VRPWEARYIGFQKQSIPRQLQIALIELQIILRLTREWIFELARRDNVYCKISGMVTEASWTEWKPEDLTPYFDTVLAAFGARRLMFGSDWPVLLVASSYMLWADSARRFISRLSLAEQDRIMGGTATEVYKLADVSY
jgi:L-fuconolactonase